MFTVLTVKPVSASVSAYLSIRNLHCVYLAGAKDYPRAYHKGSYYSGVLLRELLEVAITFSSCTDDVKHKNIAEDHEDSLSSRMIPSISPTHSCTLILQLSKTSCPTSMILKDVSVMLLGEMPSGVQGSFFSPRVFTHSCVSIAYRILIMYSKDTIQYLLTLECLFIRQQNVFTKN